MQFSFWQVYYCNSAISFFDEFRSLPCFSATLLSGEHARRLRIILSTHFAVGCDDICNIKHEKG